MKKLGLLIAMILCVTIGGVYASWTYTQSTDVADETVNMAMNLTDVKYSGSYGTYTVDASKVSMTIDPKPGTQHITALTITGDLVITFTPNSVAPNEIKESGVDSTFEFGLSNENWVYDDGAGEKTLVTLGHAGEGAHDITWVKQSDGTFTYTITATELAGHIKLNEFNLDTKVKYDAFNKVLATGQITITVSDGQTSQPSA